MLGIYSVVCYGTAVTPKAKPTASSMKLVSRLRMRFQTKLVAAFLIVISAVTGSTISLIGEQVKGNDQKRFRKTFAAQIESILEARDGRVKSQFGIGKKLAEQPFVVARLKGGQLRAGGRVDKAVRDRFFQDLPRLDSRLIGLAGKSQQRIMGVMDLEGNLSFFGIKNIENESSQRLRNRRKQISEAVKELVSANTQQVVYLPQTNPKGQPVVREFVITPVVDPATDTPVGAFLMSLTTADTSAGRAIGRYHDLVEQSFKNAIYLEEEGIFPSVPTAETRADFSILGDRVAARIAGLSETETNRREGYMVHKIAGQEHYVYFCALNPGVPVGNAWHVSAFSMAQLQKDLATLRIRAGCIGLFGMFIGIIAAIYFARHLAVPISDMSAAMRSIREGEFDVSIPVRSKDEVGLLTGAFNQMIADLKQKERYRELLGKVSDESVAQAMIEGTLAPALGGEMKQVTVLFCDIRGFTALSEDMDPSALIDMLNVHMSAMAGVVSQHYGVVDKFVGDEIMAVFGGLKSYGDDVLHACNCALKMLEERDRLNREAADQGTGRAVDIGIGITTGEVVAGCIGSHDRLNYTVVGSNVNLAARLCGIAEANQVVIDAATLSEIDHSQPETTALMDLQLKGISSRRLAFLLHGLGQPEGSTLAPVDP